MRRAAFIIAVTATSGLGLASPAPAAEVDLNFAHFMPAGSWQHRDFFTAWEQAVEEQSGGRIDVTIFPAQTLGKAPQGYDNARTGVADIAWTVQGYTAGRFPLSHIVELPGLFETAEVGSCAFQKLYDSGALDGEYGDTHVLFVHTHGPGHLHTRDKPVTTLADLEGLKIRHPTQVIGQLLQELGAEPVGMPAPQIYESMQRGTIDGYMLPWEAVDGFRVHEVSDHHTEFGFYSLAFVLTMNKGTYEGLPPDLKEVVDANSGLGWAVRAGQGFDEGDRVGKEVALENGTLYEIEGAERTEWAAAAERITRAYLADLERQGLPGGEIHEQVRGYVAECEAELGG